VKGTVKARTRPARRTAACFKGRLHKQRAVNDESGAVKDLERKGG